MTNRCRIPGNPVRQLCVGVPLGLLVTSVIFDLVAVHTEAGIWSTCSWICLYAGVTISVIGLPLTPVDNFALQPDIRLHRIRRLHEWLQAMAVLMFLGSWMLRDISASTASATGAALQLSLAGAILAVISALFGDELVVRMKSLRERRRAAGRPARYIHHPGR